MPKPEVRGFSEFSQEDQREREFLRKTFGLVQVDSQKERGTPRFAYISEFDGWAVERESFLGRWLEFSPVRRLRGIRQLGLNRDFPLPNPHTRFEHSAEVSVRAVLVLSHLARDFREEFLTLSSNYPFNLNPDLSGKEKEDEQIFKTIKLGAIYAANHDDATPAGGDAVKYIFGLDDDRDLSRILGWNFAEFSRLCREDGFDAEEVIKLFTRLAKRKDKGILGQLIHCPGGKNRGFDLDSICYTLMDAQVSLGLSWEGLDHRLRDDRFARAVKEVLEPKIERGDLSPELLPAALEINRQEGSAIHWELEMTAAYLKEQQKELGLRGREWVMTHGRELRSLHRHNSPYPYISLPSFRPQAPPQFLALKDFSPFSSLALKEGKVVFTDPHRVNNLWLLQDFLAEHIYFSPSVLGPEAGLAAQVKFNRGAYREGVSPPEKERRFLLTTSDDDLLKFLKENEPSLAYWFSDLAALGWEGGNLGRGARPVISLDVGAIEPDIVLTYLYALLMMRKMPSRLDTPVLVLGEVRRYGEVFPDRKKEIKKRAMRQGWLTENIPYWARPRLILYGDECNPLERHLLERMPHW